MSYIWKDPKVELPEDEASVFMVMDSLIYDGDFKKYFYYEWDTPDGIKCNEIENCFIQGLPFSAPIDYTQVSKWCYEKDLINQALNEKKG